MRSRHKRPRGVGNRSWQSGPGEVDLDFEHPGERRGNGDDAAGIGLVVVGLRSVKDPSLMGSSANLERLAVEVFAAQRQDLAKSQAGIGEDADHRLVTASGFGEAVHLLEAEDADRAGLLFRPWVVGADADALEGVELADFVGDRVLGTASQLIASTHAMTRRISEHPRRRSR